jgi:hypothetical protein
MSGLLEHDVVAVNFQTRFDVSLCSAEQIAADDRHTAEWGPARAATRTRWARELALFAGYDAGADVSVMAVGDAVLTTTRPQAPIYVGVVSGRYEYRPDLLVDHPHVRPIRWSGALRYQDFEGAGSPIPGIAVPALGRLHLTEEALTLVETALGAPKASLTPDVGQRVARTQLPAQTPPIHPASVPPATARPGSAPSWRVQADDEAERVPCEKIVNKCDVPGRYRHTLYRFLYRAEPPTVREDGHDLLVVAFNPNCPDDTSSATFRYIAGLAEEIGTRTITVTNIAPRRCARPADLDLRIVPTNVWDTNRQIIDRGIADATVVVAGWGQSRAHHHSQPFIERERLWLLQRLNEERLGRGLVALQFGDRAAHPRRWGQLVSQTAGRYAPWLVCLGGTTHASE